MARPKGSKMIDCPNPKCSGKVVLMPAAGEVGVCKTCSTKVKMTKALMKELGIK